MDYICQHCHSNLDSGDIYEYFLTQYDPVKALNYASRYGWSEENKKHFNRSIVIQSRKKPQYTICPDCNEKDPFKKSN